MGDAWFIGPFLIQEKWALYAFSFIVGYITVRVVVKLRSLDKAVIDFLWNGFVTFLIVWKLSYLIFHPLSTLRHPISLVYFTGGEKGIIAGVVATVIYFYWKSKRSRFSFHSLMGLAMIAGLSALGVYRLLVAMLYLDASMLIYLHALFPIAIVFFLLKAGHGKWLLSACAYSLGELFFSYFKVEMAVLLGFSWNQLFHIGVAIICLITLLQTPRKDASSC